MGGKICECTLHQTHPVPPAPDASTQLRNYHRGIFSRIARGEIFLMRVNTPMFFRQAVVLN